MEKEGFSGVCRVDDCDIWAKMGGGKVCKYDRTKTLSGRTLNFKVWPPIIHLMDDVIDFGVLIRSPKTRALAV